MEYGLGIPTRTVIRFRDGVRRLHALAEEHGRDPQSIGIALWSNSFDDSRPEQRVDDEHHLLTGGADALIEDLGALADLGVGQVLLNFQHADLGRSIESMERFAGEVMGKVSLFCLPYRSNSASSTISISPVP